MLCILAGAISWHPADRADTGRNSGNDNDAVLAELRARAEAFRNQNFYIPGDIEDAMTELDKIISEEDRQKLKSGEITPIDIHHTFGMYLRNRWGLWGGSRLAEYFNRLGIYHPDAMSSEILCRYVHRLQAES